MWDFKLLLHTFEHSFLYAFNSSAFSVYLFCSLTILLIILYGDEKEIMFVQNYLCGDFIHCVACVM